jgi:PmbA protein
MMTQKERLDTAQWALKQAKKAGAQEGAVRISASREVSVEIREGRIDKLQESQSRGLTLELFVDGRYSAHSTSKLDKAALSSFVLNAVALTRHLTEDPFRRLPEKELTQLEAAPDLQILDPSYDRVDSTRRIETARAAEAAAKACEGPIISVTAGYSDTREERTTLNSAGFLGEHASTYFSLSAEATVKDGDRGRPEAYSAATTRFLGELPPAEKIGRESVERALQRIGQAKLPSGPYDLVIENRVASRMLSALLRPLSAQSLQQKNSFLEGKLGQAIAGRKLTIIDDPFLPKGLSSRHHDGEGIASRRRTLVEEGVLKAYLLDNYYSRKLKLQPTGGQFSNLLLPGGSGSLEELLATLGGGVLITGFNGGNSNNATGDFSFGISGMLVEKGKLVKPLNEMNLTGNLLDFWGRLEAMAGDPYAYGSWRTPSLLFRGTQLSGS